MRKLIFLLLFLFLLQSTAFSDIPRSIFSKKDIIGLTGLYLESGLHIENPVFVDVDKDGDFDALKFDDGNVEYFKNVGSLKCPSFVLENQNYEKYDNAFFVNPKIPYPMFFADMDGDEDMDMFVIKDKVYNNVQNKYEYNVTSAENALDLDTGTLITIILVLVIVLLVLAILR